MAAGPAPPPLPAVAGAQDQLAAPAIPAWQPSPEQQQFLDAVALPRPEQQIESVTYRLRQANPGYQVTFEPQFAEGSGQAGPVRHLRLIYGWNSALADGFTASFDYWPLAALRELTSLDAPLAPGDQLAPLCTLPLEQLGSVAITPFHLLAPELAGALPRLKSINGVASDAWLAR
jgi:hypothetical protein